MSELTTSPRGLLTTLQAGRGLAALAVVLSHTSEILGLPRFMNKLPFDGILRQGHAGVDFFFVLSGFIIMTAHRGDIGNPKRAAVYFFRRAARIYPAYWLLVVLPACFFVSQLTAIWSVIDVLNPLFLPRAASTGFVWTLEHELLFYLMFSLLIIDRRIGALVLSLWFAACAVYAWIDPAPSWPWSPRTLWPDFFLSSYHLQFGAGMLTALAVVRFRIPFPRIVLATGIAGLGWSMWREHIGTISLTGQAARLSFGAAASVIILGLVAAERNGRLKAGRIALLLGASSYSIYVTHSSTVFFAASTVNPHFPSAPTVVALISIFAVATGVFLHVAIEAPVIRLLNQITGRRRPIEAVDPLPGQDRR